MPPIKMERPDSFAAYAAQCKRRARLRRFALLFAISAIGAYLLVQVFDLVILRRMLQIL